MNMGCLHVIERLEREFAQSVSDASGLRVGGLDFGVRAIVKIVGQDAELTLFVDVARVW